MWMNDLAGVNFIATMKGDLLKLLEETEEPYRPRWRNTYLVYGQSTHKPLSSSAHNQDIHRLYEAAGVVGKTAITHVFRHTKTCELLEAAVPALSVKLFGRWSDASAMESYEATSYKVDAMLAAAGWTGPDNYNCWWETDPKLQSKTLTDSVLIGLDSVVSLTDCIRERGITSDESAYQFCQVLKYLRKVYLEDAVYMRGWVPNFPAYRHPVLATEAFKSYTEAILQLTCVPQACVPQACGQQTQACEQQTQACGQQTQACEQQTQACVPQACEQQTQACVQQLQACEQQLQACEQQPQACVSNGKQVLRRKRKETYMIPEPPDTIHDMKSYYRSWCTSVRELYARHRVAHNGFKWALVSTNPKLAAQRFSYIKGFLEYLDGSLDPDGILEVLTKFAGRHKLIHSVVIKRVFNEMVKGVSAGREYIGLSGELRDDLTRAGYMVPKQKVVLKKNEKGGESVN